MRTMKPPSITPMTAPGERCATQVIERAEARKFSATSTRPIAALTRPSRPRNTPATSSTTGATRSIRRTRSRAISPS